MPTPTRNYRYNDTAGRFINAQGRFVSARVVRAELDASIEASAKAIRAISAQLQSGAISLSAWELALASEIRNGHLASIALAKGGWDFVTKADEREAARIIREQYKYLERFARQISTGAQRLDGRFLLRAMQYGQAFRGTYEDKRRGEERKRGMVILRNLRYARDSCVDCVGQTALGWVAIDDPRIIPIGSRKCLKRCKCQWEYSADMSLLEVMV